MTVEIIGATLKDSVVKITCINVSEEHLQYLERTRDDGEEQEIEFQFDTENPYARKAIDRWMHSQKAAQGARNWGEALAAIVGTQVQAPPYRYRVRSWA